jgi:glycerol-3-phosphate acyltransferase PlsY
VIGAIAGALIGYAIGSIPTGVGIARAWGAPDPRGIGSGATGATNVGRAAGTGAALVALALDAAKGALAAALGGPAGAFGAVAGNVASPWLRFRGGKGVATGAGAMALLAPGPLGLAAAVFGVAFAAFRWVSLASILAAISLPGWAMLLRSPRPVVICGAACAAVVLLRHRENLWRMRSGREPRWGARSGGPKA